MQRQNRRFFDSLEWAGWHGNDRPVVDCEGKDIDQALKELDRRVEGRLEEYEENQHYTKPSRERREARRRAEYRIKKGRTETW